MKITRMLLLITVCVIGTSQAEACDAFHRHAPRGCDGWVADPNCCYCGGSGYVTERCKTYLLCLRVVDKHIVRRCGCVRKCPPPPPPPSPKPCKKVYRKPCPPPPCPPPVQRACTTVVVVERGHREAPPPRLPLTTDKRCEIVISITHL